jgi:ADP-ribose pyrophosphatase
VTRDSWIREEWSDQIKTFIIGTGLSNDVLGLEHQYLDSRANVGSSEISRLLGGGADYGQGPLPLLLQSAVDTRDTDGEIRILLVRSDEDDIGHEFVESVSEVAALSSVIRVPDENLPWEELSSAISKFAGDDPEIRFLVVGCHTESGVQALATILRSVFPASLVAVSPHLVASSTKEAHFATLRHGLPSLGVDVLLDLGEAFEFLALSPQLGEIFGLHPCDIAPEEANKSLNEAQRHIVRSLCMNWTRAQLVPLAGGFSGSALFLADGWIGDAQTEPLVLKIDDFGQMRRELNGYHQVKDFLGKHVPTFGYPVGEGDSLGVAMELAAMEGRPETLQDTFEEAETQEGFDKFLARLDKTLALLSEKLYGNTRKESWVIPFRAFGLHAEQQLIWLRENAEFILGYLDEAQVENYDVDIDMLVQILRLVTANPDGVTSEVCLSHGDLNLANVICDQGDNIWLIDWTHSADAPLELDFAKIESDIKFVMSKSFELDDLDRIKRFEDFLLADPVPSDIDDLPDSLRFVKWDLRFRKILETVRRIRQTCFSLKGADDWLVYRIALLRYAGHTLSFDKRRDRGECDLIQLAYALHSVDSLALNLISDDFHLKIRAERPADYPPRQRISIDGAPWALQPESYDPPYYVSPDVLDYEVGSAPNRWSDPEDISTLSDELKTRNIDKTDDEGRPLNPRGRTGIAGRGALGLWGPNPSVSVAFVRINPTSGALDILLGIRDSSGLLETPQGFVLPGESDVEAAVRVMATETGQGLEGASFDEIHKGYMYDSRQTDNAWVETHALLVQAAEDDSEIVTQTGTFEEVKWRPLDADTINLMNSQQASLVRDGLGLLVDSGGISRSELETLLAETG